MLHRCLILLACTPLLLHGCGRVAPQAAKMIGVGERSAVPVESQAVGSFTKTTRSQFNNSKFKWGDLPIDNGIDYAKDEFEDWQKREREANRGQLFWMKK